MSDTTEIVSAITRSIQYDEIVPVEVQDIQAALEYLDNSEAITELDYAKENDGSLDVWGNRIGPYRRHGSAFPESAPFRIRLTKA